jgi:hypothetical protein
MVPCSEDVQNFCFARRSEAVIAEKRQVTITITLSCVRSSLVTFYVQQAQLGQAHIGDGG